MAQDMVRLMEMVGRPSFYLCGHDRGGRVAHRLSLDHPQRVKKLCVIDIAPTLDMYNATDMRFARAYLHAKLGGWGAKGLDHDRESRARGDQVACDMLVLWGAHGVVQKLFDPLALWQAQCTGQVEGHGLPSGHYIPEELPDDAAQLLRGLDG